MINGLTTSISSFSIAKGSWSFYIIILLPLFSACVNDMKDIERIANIQEEEAVDISKNVTVIYSDSAQVKAELQAPEMRTFHDTTGNYEFTKGVEILFFDENGEEAQRIRSDYAIQRQSKGLTEFRKNVVVTRADGSVIKTEELFHDEKEERYYNTVPIVLLFKDDRGDLQASSFTSDLDFENIIGENMTGYYISTDDSQFPSFGR
ncbi:MAG TPA: LPS export ABC transporter periplasmic protein LptC [Sphingobacterium sp.]|nr:LPS export ABC transporter periplasmic protein LptC [Sphingobacterium sp.]